MMHSTKRSWPGAVLLQAGLAVSVLLIHPSSAPAQESVVRETVEADESRLLTDLMALNSYELALSKLVTEKAQADELRALADAIAADHQQIEARVMVYANQNKIAIDHRQQQRYTERLAKWEAEPAGSQWDRSVTAELTGAHREGLTLMERLQAQNKAPEVVELVQAYLPRKKQQMDQLVLLQGSAADGTEPGNAGAAAAAAGEDAKFLADLRAMNTYDVQMMELILKKGSHRALKDAAQKMMEDHRRLEAQINTFSGGTGNVMDEEAMTKTDEKTVKWFQKRGGMEWDADVIEELVDIHKDGIDMLEDAATDAKEDRLRRLIKEALQVLKVHNEMLAPLKEKVKKPWKGK